MYVAYTSIKKKKDHAAKRSYTKLESQRMKIAGHFVVPLQLELYCLDSNLKEQQEGGMEGLLLGGEKCKTESTRCLNRPSKKGDHKASNLDFGSCLKIITVTVSVYAKSNGVSNVHIFKYLCF